MKLKRCFTFIHCDLHSKCELAHVDPANGYLEKPGDVVGEFCHHFKPLVACVNSVRAWGTGKCDE